MIDFNLRSAHTAPRTVLCVLHQRLTWKDFPPEVVLRPLPSSQKEIELKFYFGMHFSSHNLCAFLKGAWLAGPKIQFHGCCLRRRGLLWRNFSLPLFVKSPITFWSWMTRHYIVNGSAKRLLSGLVNIVPAVAYHFCLCLPKPLEGKPLYTLPDLS